MPSKINFPALISSAHTLRPFQPGSFLGKGSAERAEERANEERARRANEALRVGQLGLGHGQLGAQVRSQDLAQGRFEDTQRATLEAEQRKTKNDAMRRWTKARLSGDRAAMDVAVNDLKRVGFRVEGMAAQGPPAAPSGMPPGQPGVEAEDVKLEAFTPPQMSAEEAGAAADLMLEPAPGTGRTEEQAKVLGAFTQEQAAKEKASPELISRGLMGGLSGGQNVAKSPAPAGTRIYDSDGSLVWEDDDATVEQWYGGRVQTAFNGLIEKYKADPEALGAVLAGFEHSNGLLGSGAGTDKAIEEGIALAETELDRMGKLERAELMSKRPATGGGYDRRMSDEFRKVEAILRRHRSDKSYKVAVDAEHDLTNALNMIREDKRNGVSDRIIAQKMQKSLQGGRLSNYDMQMLFEAGGFSAQLARWYNYMAKGGELPDVFIDQMRTSMTDLLRAADGKRKETGDAFYEDVMGDPLLNMTEAERSGKATLGYKYFTGKNYGGGKGGGGAPAAGKPAAAPKPKGKKNSALMKLVEDALK